MKYYTLLFKLLLPVASAILLITIVSSCKKKDKIPASIIIINGTEYKFPDPSAMVYSGNEARLSMSGYIEDVYFVFGVRFNLRYFPTQGVYHINYNGHGEQEFMMGFVWDGQYLMDFNNDSTVLEAYERNGKGKYILGPTWFYRMIPDSTNSYFIRTNDSVLVSAEVYVPKDVYTHQ